MSRVILLTVLLAACTARTNDDHRARELDSAAEAVTDTASVKALPAPFDTTVVWSDMQRMLRMAPDSVRAVQQLHSRAVTVLFLNGHRYHAQEPAIDDIIHLLKEVDPAGRILIATE